MYNPALRYLLDQITAAYERLAAPADPKNDTPEKCQQEDVNRIQAATLILRAALIEYGEPN